MSFRHLNIWTYPWISFHYSSVLESCECDWEVQCSRIWLDWSCRWMLYTRQTLHKKMKFSIKDFFSKYDRICRKLLLITNPSLLLPPSVNTRKETLLMFVCTYKMHWVLCPQRNLQKCIMHFHNFRKSSNEIAETANKVLWKTVNQRIAKRPAEANQ